MEHIKAWKTQDGKLFESQQAANLHELFLKFQEWWNNGMAMNYEPEAEDMYGYLYENRATLLLLLEAFQDCNNAMPLE